MKPRDYQFEAINLALQYPGFGIFCEQRTGKTLIAVEITKAIKPERLLIACPKIAIRTVWKPATRQLSAPGRRIRIMTFESLWRKRAKLKRWNPDMIICDESHRIKNRKSKQSKVLRSLSNGGARHKPARYRLALTGTPLGQGPQDAWAQFDFIDQSVFGDDYDRFESRYLRKGGWYNKQIIGTKNQKEFKEKFHSRMIRFELEEVKPQKTDIQERVVLVPLKESLPYYRRMENEFMVDLRKKRITAPRVITQIMKLHQLAGGHIIDENKHIHRVGDEKIIYCAALVMRLMPSYRKLVIVVKFIHEITRLRQVLTHLGFSVQVIASKEDEFRRFNTDIVIVQIQSALAIDLAESWGMIFHSFHYSFLDFEQAKFRIRSFHGTRAHYFYLLADNTRDLDIYQALTLKRGVASYVLSKIKKGG